MLICTSTNVSWPSTTLLHITTGNLDIQVVIPHTHTHTLLHGDYTLLSESETGCQLHYEGTYQY